MNAKLLRAVGKLEASAAARASSGPVGLVMASDYAELGRELGPDEFLAVDFWFLSRVGSCVEARAAERCAADPADVGAVFDADGLHVGRVVSLDGPVVSIEFDDGAFERFRTLAG